MSFIKSKLPAINNNMKNTFKTLLFISLLCGVSGAGEIKSVMEGDSVTLHTDDTEIPTGDKIMWWFNGALIAQISDEGEIELYEDVADGRFRGRLKLDHQTGSLNITNTRTDHSGDYKIEISTNTGTTEKTFTLTVYDSPSVIDPDRSEVKPVEVMEGKSVSLNTDINPHGDELIVWRFGDNGILIAKDDKENKISLYPDGRFRDRIHLDQTGSLIITDIRTADTGEYKLKISSNRDTKHKRFNLYVREPPPPPPPPMSGGAIAGIIIGVLIGAAAAVVLMLVIAFMIYLKIQYDQWRTVIVMKGESVPLITDDVLIKRFKVNVYYGGTLIAEIRRGEITPVKAEFRERLKLDHQTGSLIISNGRRTDAGVYILKIIISTAEITYKRIIVNVRGDVISKPVMMGVSVDLSSDVTELQEDAEVEWKFENTVIAHKKQKDKKISLRQDAFDEIFKQNLKVDQHTGSLSIINSRTDQSGDYELNISSRRATVHKIIRVTVFGDVISKRVKEGDSVDLSSDVTELQEDAEVEWKFENTVIAHKKPKEKTISLRQEAHDGKFKQNLKVDQKTGSLTIINSRRDHSGDYELNITSSRITVHQIINVKVYDTSRSVPIDGVNESDGLLNEKQVTSPV